MRSEVSRLYDSTKMVRENMRRVISRRVGGARKLLGPGMVAAGGRGPYARDVLVVVVTRCTRRASEASVIGVGCPDRKDSHSASLRCSRRRTQRLLQTNECEGVRGTRNDTNPNYDLAFCHSANAAYTIQSETFAERDCAIPSYLSP